MALRTLVRIGLSGLLMVGGATGTIVTSAGQAGASTSDGTLTVEVLRDFFGTGVINATMDVPQRGMKVTVTDPAGHHVTGSTDATGKVVVSPSTELTGGRYRVDVTVPAPYNGYLRAAPASTAPTPSVVCWTGPVARRNGAAAPIGRARAQGSARVI